MTFAPGKKYLPYLSRFDVALANRTWPDQQILKAPTWCSVDLRDGNQALINPMNISQKIEFFKLLVRLGFREIEIGFPSASQTEFDFARKLVEEKLIPDDVVPQMLTQAREHLIRKTYESLIGTKKAIVHLYNSTSEVQRRVVFRRDKKQIIDLAVEGTKLVKSLSRDYDTHIVFEYSPESFTGTELEFARDVCEAVMDVWQPTTEDRLIINLPATVEMSTPNVYADQIEWFATNTSGRDKYILSLHTHNDRGTGIAATELGLMAGADRVEGTLFGNGERTGNVDIVTLALNLYSQGVDPELELGNLEEVRRVAELCTGIPVHCRHPYAGELVFTAFSGSHQDAISKGMHEQCSKSVWEVPYIPIDPADIGRRYDAIVRINSQSGKGGVAYVLEAEYGIEMPKAMHPEFAQVVQALSERTGQEVLPSTIMRAFEEEYLEQTAPVELQEFHSNLKEDGRTSIVTLDFLFHGESKHCVGEGNGPIDAAVHAFKRGGVADVTVAMFAQHSCTSGSDAKAVTFIQLQSSDGRSAFGVGIHASTSLSSIRALIAAINRLPT